MRSSGTHSREAVVDEAAQWFVRNRGDSLDSSTRISFMEWLKASPVHIEEYLAIATLARDVVAASADPRLDLESHLARVSAESDNVVPLDPLRRRSTKTGAAVRGSQMRRRAVAATAAILIVAAAIWSTRDGERFGLSRTYSTLHGEQRLQMLPDGSVVHLNTDSEVTVRYSNQERVVDLNRGQALFEVTHDGQRRFRVVAGPAGIVAVGTQFDVYRKTDSATVTVIEGTVTVYAGAVPRPVPAAMVSGYSVRLGPGYQIDAGAQMGAPRRVDGRSATAWLKKQIAFENAALGEVAAEFNRYGRIAFEIDDEAVRALPISGVFDAYDADSFAAFLGTLNGVVVQKTPTRIRVISDAAARRESLSVDR